MLQNPRSLDELRERFPHLGFALYALTPGGLVTLEVHTDDLFYSFTGLTESAVIEAAFPTPDPAPLPSILD